MKRYILLFILGIVTLCSKAQLVSPQVCENVELMSILSRLAGYPEYSMDVAGKYVENMDSYFKDHKKHPMIQYMQKIRMEYGISYDAVMSMAVHLKKEGSTYSLIEEVSSLEKRWKNVDKNEFITCLNSFYKDTEFNEFFLSQKKLYDKGLESYKENVLKYFDLDWYSNFYGNEPQESFSVIIGFCNGGGNYGVERKIKGKSREVFAIVGYCENKEGLPMYSKDYLPTLIHEFNHSFVNYLLDGNRYPEHVEGLEAAATSLFDSSRWCMYNQAYRNWKTMINESIVRAAVICYMLDHNHTVKEVRKELIDQIQRNFRWMPELVSLLRTYEKKQGYYKTLEKFYPHIISFFQDYAEKENDRFDLSLK